MTQSTQGEPKIPMTFVEYLEFEEKSPVKHEFVNGRLRAMAGGSRVHGQIITNVTANIHRISRGKGCRVYSSDVKTVVNSSGYYPDVMLACGPSDDDKLIERNPCVIVEVLSPSTAITDYNEKRWAYSKISTLEQYIIVSSDTVQVEVNTRHADGWLSRVYITREDSFLLDSLNASLTLEGIYEDIEF